MPLNPGIISSIVSGSVNLTGQLISFGGQMAAIKNQKAPAPDIQNFEINIPGFDNKAFDLNIVILALVIIVLIGAAIFLTMKYVK